MNNAVWIDALCLAKEQVRCGKINYKELRTATNQIYTSLISLAEGPSMLAVVETETSAENMSGDNQDKVIEYKFKKHKKAKTFVRCAVCGKMLKFLSEPHLRNHGMTKEEYCQRFNCRFKDLTTKKMVSGTESKTVTKRVINTVVPRYENPTYENPRYENPGYENPLRVLRDIMVEFNLGRSEVTPYLEKLGFKGISGLKKFAQENKKTNIEALKYAVRLSQKAC